MQLAMLRGQGRVHSPRSQLGSRYVLMVHEDEARSSALSFTQCSMLIFSHEQRPGCPIQYASEAFRIGVGKKKMKKYYIFHLHDNTSAVFKMKVFL